MICLYQHQVFSVPTLTKGVFVVVLAEQRSYDKGPNAGRTLWWVEAMPYENYAPVLDQGGRIGFPQEDYPVEVLGHHIPAVADEDETDAERIFVVVESKSYGYDGTETSVLGVNRTRDGAVERIKRAFAARNIPFETARIEPDAYVIPEATFPSFRAETYFEIESRAIGA